MRQRLSTRGHRTWPRLPYGLPPRVVGRGLAKIVAAIAVAAVIGLAIGAVVAQLSGDGDSPTGGSPGASGPTSTAKRDAAQRGKSKGVRVRILSVNLHLAQTPSGRPRQRARLSVRVRVTNRGSGGITLPRPVLATGNARIRTDPSADSPATNVRTLDAGADRRVALRFEIAGAVTERVLRERRVSLIMGGRRTPAALTR